LNNPETEGGGRKKKLIWLVVREEFWKWQAGQLSFLVRVFSVWKKFMNKMTNRKVKSKARLKYFLYPLIIVS